MDIRYLIPLISNRCTIYLSLLSITETSGPSSTTREKLNGITKENVYESEATLLSQQKWRECSMLR